MTLWLEVLEAACSVSKSTSRIGSLKKKNLKENKSLRNHLCKKKKPQTTTKTHKTLPCNLCTVQMFYCVLAF